MIRTSSIFPKDFFAEESTRRTPKEQGSKGFNSSISYIILGITKVLAPTSQRAKQEKLFMEASTYGGFYSKLILPRFNESIGDMLCEGKIKCANVGVSRHFVQETNNLR